jgi:hypothetical protein
MVKRSQPLLAEVELFMEYPQHESVYFVSVFTVILGALAGDFFINGFLFFAVELNAKNAAPSSLEQSHTHSPSR